MPNRYPGTCYKCGNHVPVGAGVFEYVSYVQRRKWPKLPRSVKWLTQHHECVRDYAQDAHFQFNPQQPLVSDAKYKPAAEKEEA